MHKNEMCAEERLHVSAIFGFCFKRPGHLVALHKEH